MDIDATLALWNRAETGPSSTEAVADVRWLLDRDPEALLLSDAEGEIVGSLIVGWDGWRGTFYRLAVDPTHRRRESEEADAMAFWASAGYQLQTARSRFVKNLP